MVLPGFFRTIGLLPLNARLSDQTHISYFFDEHKNQTTKTGYFTIQNGQLATIGNFRSNPFLSLIV
ncbi:MAG: hypothetical protein CR994_00620 [Maribacter sp.]|nr:MAG: hypothetical protein CR994_00620 [Maribacter sp.]